MPKPYQCAPETVKAIQATEAAGAKCLVTYEKDAERPLTLHIKDGRRVGQFEFADEEELRQWLSNFMPMQ